MKKIFRLILKLIVVLILLPSVVSGNTTYYVRCDVTPPGGNGLSYANAFYYIQDALNVAASGDNILVSNAGNNLYQENLQWPLVDGIVLSGYDYTSSGLKPVIDGGNNFGSVIRMTSYDPDAWITPLTRINSFELINGTNQKGGGIYMDGNVAPTLEFLDINNNYASMGGGIFYHPYSNVYFWDPNCGDNGGYDWHDYARCHLSHSEIHSNTAEYGAGIYLSYDEQSTNQYAPEINWEFPYLNLGDCNITDNNADEKGGGIYIDNASILVDGSNINSNETKNAEGGGIYCHQGWTRFNNVTIGDNSSGGDGGGVYLDEGLTLDPDNYNECSKFDGFEHIWTNVYIIGNFTARGDYDGGGIYIGAPSSPLTPLKQLDLKFINGEITESFAGRNGGGIYVGQNARLYLFDILITDNTAMNDGGGIYNNCDYNIIQHCGWTPEHYFEQLLLIFNNAANYGGGIYTKQTFYCINSTIASNWTASANEDGGALACFSYSYNSTTFDVRPVFYNTIIYGNYYNSGSGSSNQVYLDDDYCIPQFDYCDIQDYNATYHGFNGPGAASWTDLLWDNTNYLSSFNIYDDPKFVNPDPQVGDFHLDNSSPCKDAGAYISGQNVLLNCNGWAAFQNFTSPFPWDYDFQGGNTRVYDYIIDIGAYENTPAKSHCINNQNNNKVPSTVGIVIQPNPWNSDQELEIIITSPQESAMNISLTDVFGQKIIADRIVVDGLKKISLNNAKLNAKPGLYFINFEYINKDGSAGKITKKVVKT